MWSFRYFKTSTKSNDKRFAKIGRNSIFSYLPEKGRWHLELNVSLTPNMVQCVVNRKGFKVSWAHQKWKKQVRIVAKDYSVPGKRAKMTSQCQKKWVVVSLMTFEVFGSRKEILARTQLDCLFFFFFLFDVDFQHSAVSDHWIHSKSTFARRKGEEAC